MSATVHQVSALADVNKFMSETGAESTHGECHNALTWLAIQIKRAGLDCYNVHLCTGVFARYDHSWLEIEDTDMEKFTVIDMTVNQFGKFQMPYVGPRSPGYWIHNSVALSDEERLPDFIEGLG